MPSDICQPHYPDTLPLQAFVADTYRQLQAFGFAKDNTLAAVAVCRDELTRPFVDAVEGQWGHAFTLSALAGIPLLGKTGFTAALHHAPTLTTPHRFVFFVLAHIALADDGRVGICQRPGQREASGACGALLAFRAELESRRVRFDLDPDDLEQSLLKQRLVQQLPYGEVPDMVTLTERAHDVAVAELERLIGLTVRADQSAWAVLSGIQIHRSQARDDVAPRKMYAVVEGRRHDLSLAPPCHT